jgi:hypothetical protein
VWDLGLGYESWGVAGKAERDRLMREIGDGMGWDERKVNAEMF